MKRTLFRLAFLILFSVLALCVLPDAVRWANGKLPLMSSLVEDKVCAGFGWASSLLPRLSPLLSLGGAVGARRFVGLFGVPLLILPLFKGRLFCWWVCPMGFVAETVSRVSPSKIRLTKIPWVGKGLALLMVASSCAGYPLLIWLDPLCMFNGFFAAWQVPFAWGTLVLSAGFFSVVAVSLIIPNVWCHRLCPLGGVQEWIASCRRRRQNATATVGADPCVRPDPCVRLGRTHGCGGRTHRCAPTVARRSFLGFVAAGVGGLAGRKVLGKNKSSVIRPPSAAETSFNALCARCGNCMKACPYGLIVPDLGESGIDGLLTPVIKFRSQNPQQERFCSKECVACTRVCPTGALKMLSVKEKEETSIGVAKLDKVKCIAWEKQEYCVVCQEFCPYQAVIEEEHKGVNCPIIDEAICRGCGACESQCPALPIAIIIERRQ